MSKDLNEVNLIGRLGGDPSMRFTAQGKAVTNFSVATGREWKNAAGEQQTDTEWHNIVVWDKLAEICNEYLSKGSRIYIKGRLQTRSWDDATSGGKKYKTEIVASDMIILDSNKRDDNAPASQRQAAPATQSKRQPVDEDELEF